MSSLKPVLRASLCKNADHLHVISARLATNEDAPGNRMRAVLPSPHHPVPHQEHAAPIFNNHLVIHLNPGLVAGTIFISQAAAAVTIACFCSRDRRPLFGYLNPLPGLWYNKGTSGGSTIALIDLLKNRKVWQQNLSLQRPVIQILRITHSNSCSPVKQPFYRKDDLFIITSVKK